MNSIAELWAAGTAPGWDGLYRADGTARGIEVDGARLSWFDLGSPLDLNALLAKDPYWLAEIDITTEVELPDGSGRLCAGDGAHGSQGFFARLTPERKLMWLVSLSDSNPFTHVTVDGTSAKFTNNLGNSLTVDLTAPDLT